MARNLWTRQIFMVVSFSAVDIWDISKYRIGFTVPTTWVT